MSIVIVALSKDLIIFAAAIDISNGSIVTEDFTKLYKVNDNVCVGFAGDAYRTELMIDYLKYQKSRFDIDNFSVIDVKKNLLLEGIDNPDVNMKFLIAGKTKTKRFLSFSIDYHDGIVETNNLTIPKDGFAFVSASSDKNGDYDNIITGAVEEAKAICGSVEECIITGLSNAIKEISCIDDTVNDHISFEIISA